MAGWMDGCMDAWMDGWTDGRMDGRACIHAWACMYECMQHACLYMHVCVPVFFFIDIRIYLYMYISLSICVFMHTYVLCRSCVGWYHMNVSDRQASEGLDTATKQAARAIACFPMDLESGPQYIPSIYHIRVVVKIMVPFWVLSTILQLVFRGPKKGHNFDNHPCVKYASHVRHNLLACQAERGTAAESAGACSNPDWGGPAKALLR